MKYSEREVTGAQHEGEISKALAELSACLDALEPSTQHLETRLHRVSRQVACDPKGELGAPTVPCDTPLACDILVIAERVKAHRDRLTQMLDALEI